MCKYCYANYDEKQVLKNMKEHGKGSRLLIGYLKDDNIIKEGIKLWDYLINQKKNKKFQWYD